MGRRVFGDGRGMTGETQRRQSMRYGPLEVKDNGDIVVTRTEYGYLPREKGGVR